MINLAALKCPAPGDVTDGHTVRELACRAVEHFGRLNVQVNGAAVQPNQ